jgi:hypothetical protein
MEKNNYTIIPNHRPLYVAELIEVDDVLRGGIRLDITLSPIVAWKVQGVERDLGSRQGWAVPIGINGSGWLEIDGGFAIYDRDTEFWEIPDVNSGKGLDSLYSYAAQVRKQQSKLRRWIKVDGIYGDALPTMQAVDEIL